jgi:glutamate-1-semialdehyde 2,1-aminomutase
LFSNFSTLVLGHNHPAVLAAIQRQLARGTSFFGPTDAQTRLAQLLQERILSLEQVRFTNSGTEATMNAVRAARAFTGRSMIAKCEGGYHGTHEALAVSVTPSLIEAGSPDRPANVPADPGLPQSVVDQVLVLPFNNPTAAERLIMEHRYELAAVIVEPALGTNGMVPATTEFLSTLRRVTASNGILLVFDEVVTFQSGFHGAQGRYGITPDMTTLGKVIGGGMPVGAFGGRKDVMAVYDPKAGGAYLSHAGTFNGHPLAMAAGAATLEHLTERTHAALEAKGELLRQRVRAACTVLEVPVQVTGIGPLFGIHFTDRPVHTYRDTLYVDREFRRRVFLGLLNEGYLLGPKLLGCISTPVEEGHILAFTDALTRVIARNIR